MNISSRYSTHAFTTILPSILWSFVRMKFKMADSSPFLFAQIDKIFENFVGMNISNTNEHFFQILYTCINYYPPMNPVKFRLDQIHNGRLIAIFVCSNWQNQSIFVSDNLHMHLLIILPWILKTDNRVFTQWGIPLRYTCIIYTSWLKRPMAVLISSDHVASPHMTLASPMINLASPNFSSKK